MRRLLLLVVIELATSWMLPGQRLSPAEFRALGQACAPGADERELLALARTESNLNPWALSVNRPALLSRRMGYLSGRVFLRHQPKTKAEAMRWARELEAQGVTVSVGILQVNRENSSYAVEQLLDPCRNLKEGWTIFASAYRKETVRFGAGQRALLAAFGAYNTGSALEGFKNGYVSSILTNWH